ncbi:hypothetical protein C1I95_28890 [Micromonospora craterilacus]|uniref:ATP/GTP-binding protein n=1 Tax=Micromonospora craterilacus TaxID=1655439 RepID=A0A2W2DWT9_9ACTN|nr:hypothetical protein [Micromonospora craterilacus]PZG09555.1 hypothetical protein C1I95_28890 [Micromonospora craterilacus]
MLRRPLLGGLVASVVAVAGMAWPARADDGIGHVDCAQSPTAPECEITAGIPGGPGGSNGGSGRGNGGSGDSGGNADSDCYWLPVDSDRPPPAGKGPEGGWYARTCLSDGVGSQATPVWLDQAPGVDLPDLAQIARSRLSLTAPRIRTNPDTEPFVLVRVPVWLWVDPVTWQARSATASVPGVTVTATATPTRVRWSFGDGTKDLTCLGPGKPWTPDMDPRAASPCGHTYTRSSAATAGNAFRLRATVTWSVTWSGPGAGGTLDPLTTTATMAVPVGQSQAVVERAR